MLVVILVVLLLAAVAVLMYAQKDAVYAQLNAWHLVPVPERFTELYFEDHTKLPTTIAQGEPASFSFTIHNLEGATTVYPYQVYFRYLDGTQVVFSTGTVQIPDNGYDTTGVVYKFISSPKQGSIGVNLLNLNQRIDFLLPKNT